MAQPEGVIFDRPSAERIDRVVRRFKDYPVDKPESDEGFKPGPKEFWAEITGSAEEGSVFYHSWKEVRITHNNWEDADGGLTGTTTEGPIVSPDFSELTTGTHIRVRFEVYEDESSEG